MFFHTLKHIIWNMIHFLLYEYYNHVFFHIFHIILNNNTRNFQPTGLTIQVMILLLFFSQSCTLEFKFSFFLYLFFFFLDIFSPITYFYKSVIFFFFLNHPKVLVWEWSHCNVSSFSHGFSLERRSLDNPK